MPNVHGIRILEQGSKISDNEIRELEDTLGYSLPNDYRTFLLTYNGGRPEPDVFNYEIRKNEIRSSSVRNFFCVDKEGMDAFNEILLVYAGRLPKDMFPIAYDSCGNLICLCIAGEHRGRIYFWDHEEEYEEDELPGYKNIYPISLDFYSFLVELH
jgi:hypothetical protein